MLTTTYHTQTKLTERVNGKLKYMIAVYGKDNHRHWDRWLPEFRFTLNTAWHESTGFNLAEVSMGLKLKDPMERAVIQSVTFSCPCMY